MDLSIILSLRKILRSKCVLLRAGVWLAVCLFSPLVTHAQDPFRGWQWQNPLPQGNSINAIRFAPDKRHGWAIGSNGVVLTTNNGGVCLGETNNPSQPHPLWHVC